MKRCDSWDFNNIGFDDRDDVISMDFGHASCVDVEAVPEHRWRRPVAALFFLAAAVSGVVAVRFPSKATSVDNLKKLSTDNLRADSGASLMSVTVHREGYDPVPEHTRKMYGLADMVVEPHAIMLFHASATAEERVVFNWEFTALPDPRAGAPAPAVGLLDTTSVGPKKRVIFAGINSFFTARVVTTSEDGTILDDRSLSIICKIVRREIRRVTKEDREKYLSALEIMWNTSQTEGEAKYGSSFISHGHLTSLHDSNYYSYHGNLFFLTSHPAMQLKLDNSILSIDPTIIPVYWDFLVDSELGKDWTSAPVYDKDWFGSAQNSEEDDCRVRGRFRDVELIYDPEHTTYPKAQHTPTGYLAETYSVIRDKNLQRTNYVCGFPSTQGFSNCEHVRTCFESYLGSNESLWKFDHCLEQTVHANLHVMHAGLWDCQVSWSEFYDKHSSWLKEDLLSFIAPQARAGIVEMIARKLVTCPETCDIWTTSFASCSCHPVWATVPGVFKADDVDLLTNETVYNYLESFFEILVNAYDSDKYIWKDSGKLGTSTDGYHFLGVNETWQFHELNRFLLKTVFFPGVWGVMGSGAAANDPLFWVMHQMFDKATHALRLSPRYNTDHVTWDNVIVKTGGGEYWNSSTTPFKADIFESHLGPKLSAHSGSDYLTNQQLWALLKPDGHSIPYIYDQLTHWGTCDFDPMHE